VASNSILVSQELTNYLIFALPIFFIELMAAVSGTIYLRKVPSHNKYTKYFVWFLWFTLFIEIVGTYAPIAYFSEYKFFSFIEGTIVVRNRWLYNIYNIIKFVFLVYYFRSFIKRKFNNNLLRTLILLFILTSVLNLVFTDVFFKFESQYINLTGTFLLMFSIILFFFQLLKSDHILNLKRFLPLYIAIAVMLFYLCVTPVSIYSEFFSASGGNQLFVDLHARILLYSNIFMYSFLIFGFIICSRTKEY